MLISREHLSINPVAEIDVDAVSFETSCKALFEAPAEPGTLQQMLALSERYQGQFLADVALRNADSLDEWILYQQRHLNDLYLRLLFEITEQAIQHHDYETGIANARLLITLDPLWDASRQQLMRLLVYSNRHNEALQEYEAFAALLDDELGTAPDAESIALYEQIRNGDLQIPPDDAIQGDDLADSLYIEPADDLEIAERMLNIPQCRLLTLFGIGGIGKTALATRLSVRRKPQYQDGVCFVALNTADTIQEFLQLMASALNVHYSNSMAQSELEQHLIKALQNQEILLVLDNYEQLLPDTDFIQRILTETARVQMIITARTPLNLYNEYLLPLRGLSIPEPDSENPQDYEALRLFDLTAQRINPHFSLDDSLNEVIAICHLVDSLPLGIVIAAGWVQYIPPAEILAMMQENLLSVEAVHNDVPRRHRSFENLLDSMLLHLSAEEQRILMCLSIFEGSFDHKAALAIADIAMPVFKRLTDKCLVQRTDNYRYTMHSLLRQIFKGRLEDSDMLRDVVGRYMTHFQQWCDDIFEQCLPLHKLIHTIEVEQRNLWMITGMTDLDRQRFILEIAPAMNEYWLNRGYHKRGILEILKTGTRNRAIVPETRIRGMVTLARLLERTSQYDASWQTCERILEIEPSLDRPYFRARALRVMSEICVIQGAFTEAMDYLQQIIQFEHMPVASHPPMAQLISLAYEDMGEILMSQGDYEKAEYHIQVSIQRWRDSGETLRITIPRSYLGIIAVKEKNYEEAFEIFTEVLQDARNAKNQTLITIFTFHLGSVALRQKDYVTCCTCFTESLQIALQIDRKTTLVRLAEETARLSIALQAIQSGVELWGFAAALRNTIKMYIEPHHLPDHQALEDELRAHAGNSFEEHFETGYKTALPGAVQIMKAIMTTTGTQV